MTKKEARTKLIAKREELMRIYAFEEAEALTIAIEALKREDTMRKEIERAVLYGERGEVNE